MSIGSMMLDMMRMLLLLAPSAVMLTGCESMMVREPDPVVETAEVSPAPQEWNAWARWIENRYPISDDQGHGPDIGSNEWAMAVDRNLGVTVGGHGPDLKSDEWRSAVEFKLAALAKDDE